MGHITNAGDVERTVPNAIINSSDISPSISRMVIYRLLGRYLPTTIGRLIRFISLNFPDFL
jgi:hypothetical protein